MHASSYVNSTLPHVRMHESVSLVENLIFHGWVIKHSRSDRNSTKCANKLCSSFFLCNELVNLFKAVVSAKIALLNCSVLCVAFVLKVIAPTCVVVMDPG